MVQVSRAVAWLQRVRPRRRHVGNRMHHGWAEWRPTSLPRRQWNGLTLLDPKSPRHPHRRLVGEFQEEPQIQRTQVPWRQQARDFGKEVHEQSVKESTQLDDWPPQNGPSRKTHRRTSSSAPLVWRHPRPKRRRPAAEHDRNYPATNLQFPV